jgi:hypothetical protein
MGPATRSASAGGWIHDGRLVGRKRIRADHPDDLVGVIELPEGDRPSGAATPFGAG